MKSKEEIKPDDLDLFGANSTSTGPQSHTQNFDRAAFYGTSRAQRLENKGQAFLNSCKGQLMTVYLYTVNFAFAVLSLAIITVGIMTGQAHEQQLVGAVSDDFALAIIIFGLALLAFAILGFSAAKTANRCLLFLYIIGVFILLFALGAIMLAQALATRSHRVEEIMRHTWEKAVANHPEEICDLQHDLKCSGFSSDCVDAPPGRVDCANCTNPEDVPAPQACWGLLQHKIHDNFKPITYVCLGTLSVTMLALMAACGICQHMRIKSRERALYESLSGSEP